jgi:hypothetical protein
MAFFYGNTLLSQLKEDEKVGICNESREHCEVNLFAIWNSQDDALLSLFPVNSCWNWCISCVHSFEIIRKAFSLLRISLEQIWLELVEIFDQC